MVSRLETDSTYVELPPSHSIDQIRDRASILKNHLSFPHTITYVYPEPANGRQPRRPAKRAPPPRPPAPHAPLTRPHPHSNPRPQQDAYTRARELTKSHHSPKKSSVRVIQNPSQAAPTPANSPPNTTPPKKDPAVPPTVDPPKTPAVIPCVDPDGPPRAYAEESDKQPMMTFELPGIKLSRGCIGGINGIGTDLVAAKSLADYLRKLIGNYHIEWVHNRTKSIPMDLVETLILTFRGISSPAEQLQTQWKNFHEKHKNDPTAKYLQICHSQGALHVKNALLSAPQEIRDRVIVIAIAPATLVPKSLCFNSYNYTSKRDLLPYGQTAALLALEGPSASTIKTIFETKRELIILDPHPEASLVDHGFKSPTFKETIAKHIQEYIHQAGVDSSTIA